MHSNHWVPCPDCPVATEEKHESPIRFRPPVGAAPRRDRERTAAQGTLSARAYVSATPVTSPLILCRSTNPGPRSGRMDRDHSLSAVRPETAPTGRSRRSPPRESSSPPPGPRCATGINGRSPRRTSTRPSPANEPRRPRDVLEIELSGHLVGHRPRRRDRSTGPRWRGHASAGRSSGPSNPAALRVAGDRPRSESRVWTSRSAPSAGPGVRSRRCMTWPRCCWTWR